MRDATAPPPVTAAPAELAALRAQLRNMAADQALAFFEPRDPARLLKTTISLCSECLAHVPALVFTRAGRVWMSKRCAAHGAQETLIESDEEFYHLSNKDCWGARYAPLTGPAFPAQESATSGPTDPAAPVEPAAAFADQWQNKSCTLLLEVTNACNLACPVCYSDARGDRQLPLEQMQRHVLELIRRKGPLDSLQLTGGEAALHPQFWEMLDFLLAQPVKKIYLPTNGLLFAQPANANRLAAYRDKLMVLLQFDGRQPSTNRAMRDADPTPARDRVVQNLERLGIHMQLTMTITQGVNDHEIGWVVETGLKHSHIKVVALQPVTYSGRYQLPQHAHERMTLSDCVKAVAAQVARRTRAADFKPIPCSHPNCGWITLFVQRFGITTNIARHIDLGQAMNQVSNRTLLNSRELRSVVGTARTGRLQQVGLWAARRLIRSTDVFAVAIKPFMDRFNYDQDRISSCCHHLISTHGEPVSFCEYNARIRPSDSWDRFPLLKEAKADRAP